MVDMGQIYVKPASFQISFAEGLTDQKIKKKKKKNTQGIRCLDSTFVDDIPDKLNQNNPALSGHKQVLYTNADSGKRSI